MLNASRRLEKSRGMEVNMIYLRITPLAHRTASECTSINLVSTVTLF
jgi:hypothetical protein